MALHQKSSFIYKRFHHMASGLYFGKPLSNTTICCYIHKCQLKLYCGERKPNVNSVQKHRRLLCPQRHLGWTITQCRLLCPQRHLGWTITQWKRVLWSDESVFWGEKLTTEEKHHPDCYQQQVQ